MSTACASARSDSALRPSARTMDQAVSMMSCLVASWRARRRSPRRGWAGVVEVIAPCLLTKHARAGPPARRGEDINPLTLVDDPTIILMVFGIPINRRGTVMTEATAVGAGLPGPLGHR